MSLLLILFYQLVVHNINRWDMVNYNFVNDGTVIRIVPVGYQMDSDLFYNNLMKTTDLLIDLKRYVESFITKENIRTINSICKIESK